MVAPLVFIELEGPTAGGFIRKIFPWYYIFIGGLSSVAAVLLLFGRPIEALIMGAVLIGAFVSRQVLMPRINLYRDRNIGGDAQANLVFTRLHRLSVLVNLLQMILCLIVLIQITVT